MEDETLTLFFRLLDDSELVAHINRLSQAAALGDIPQIGQESEPIRNEDEPAVFEALATRIPSVLSSFGSDPFNDDLDSVLLRLDSKPKSRESNEEKLAPCGAEEARLSLAATPSFLSFEIPGNQLAAGIQAAADTDNDEKASQTSDPAVDAVNVTKHDIANSLGNELFDDVPPLASYSSPVHILESKEGLSSSDEADDSNFGKVGAQHDFGDFNTYFENKHRKQQLSDKYFLEWEKKRRRANGESSQIPAFFAGCIIFVNGNTAPSITAIHRMVVLHGGTFLHYLNNKSAATHIICDKLTPRKRMEFKNYKVVKAKWISDCVEKQTLLDWKDYRLIDDVAYDQKRLGFERVSQHQSKVEQLGDPRLGEIEEEEKELESVSGELDHPDLEDFVDLEEGDILENDLSQKVGKYLGDVGAIENIETPQIVEEKDKKTADHDPSTNNISQLQISRPRHAFGQMDAKHPDFLAHFFANSRLHHLSTWKADLRSKFIRLVAKGTPPQVKRADVSRLILHIDFDCFFATVSALSHPNLDINRDPIAVSHGGKSSDVASCNYVARLKGVRNGLWLGNAMTLCPDLKVIDYDFNAYEKASHDFYTYLISARVFDSILPVLIDEALVDASSHCSQQNFDVESFLKEIRADILKLTGCPVSIGASRNVLLAKLSTRRAKPNGQFYLKKNIEEFISGVKLRDLPGMGYGLCKKLADETDFTDPSNIFVRDVKDYPLQKLTRSLGEVTGLKLFNYCRGIDATSIQLDTSSCEALLGRKTVSVEVNFGIRFDSFPQVELFLMNVAKELQSRMINIGVCGSRLSLKLAKRQPNSPINPPKYLGMGKVDFFTRTTNLGMNTNDWGLVGSEMVAIARSLNIPPEELRGVGVTMGKLVDLETARKEHQHKLQFKQRSRTKAVAVDQSSQSFPFAERVVNSNSIDWDVFSLLPDAIKREFKTELLRRGIPVSSNERSPTKNNGRKVFLQQVFPSQPYGTFKAVKVIESPTKKRKKNKESPTKIANFVKEESPTPYNETISYDEEVLNEIPSSIRNEFIADCERQKKNKKLRFVSMREKLEIREQVRRNMEANEIDAEWLAAQPVLVQTPVMAGLSSVYSEMLEQLENWIKLSITEEGPHPEDAMLFEKFIRENVERGLTARAMNLIKFVNRILDAEVTKTRLCCSDEEGLLLKRGIDEWIAILVRLKRVAQEACPKKNCTLLFE